VVIAYACKVTAERINGSPIHHGPITLKAGPKYVILSPIFAKIDTIVCPILLQIGTEPGFSPQPCGSFKKSGGITKLEDKHDFRR